MEDQHNKYLKEYYKKRLKISPMSKEFRQKLKELYDEIREKKGANFCPNCYQYVRTEVLTTVDPETGARWNQKCCTNCLTEVL